MARHTQVAVIAPEQLIGAFSVLIHSESSLELLASATDLAGLKAVLANQMPDVILIYLVQECEANNGRSAFEIIGQLKSTWPEPACIAIVKYASQRKKILESGADVALVEGTNAERLLNALEGKLAK